MTKISFAFKCLCLIFCLILSVACANKASVIWTEGEVNPETGLASHILVVKNAPEGLGWSFDLGDHTLEVSYSLYEGSLDLVSVTCDGEDVELTEAMTGLAEERLFLAPVWLEALGAKVQWDPQSLTLDISFGD